MASPAIGVNTCTLDVNLFSGARIARPSSVNALLTVRNGNQQDVSLPNNGFISNSQIIVKGLPFFDNFADNYAVVASATGYEQAGFFPVALSPEVPGAFDIMLLGQDADRSTFQTYGRLSAVTGIKRPIVLTQGEGAEDLFAILFRPL